MTIEYNDIKHMAKIEIATGRAALPDYEDIPDDKFRDPNMDDAFGDAWAVKDLYRRMKVLEAMNYIIRCANNEEVAFGDWLYLVGDDIRGLDFAYYTNDEDFFEVCESFKEIVSEFDVHDLFY